MNSEANKKLLEDIRTLKSEHPNWGALQDPDHVCPPKKTRPDMASKNHCFFGIRLDFLSMPVIVSVYYTAVVPT